MLERTAQIQVEGAPDLAVVAFTSEERLHAPFLFRVTCAAADPVSEQDLLGAPATLSVAIGTGDLRTIHAVVDAIRVGLSEVVFELVPEILARTDAVDHRVFVNKNAVQIAESILGEHGISVDDRTDRAVPSRAQTMQAWESDLDFLSRILAEEGLAWMFTPDAARLAIVGSPGGFDDEGLRLRVAQDAGLEADHAVFDVAITERLAPDGVVVNDYDFTRPATDLKADATSGSLGCRHQVFPGRHADGASGETRAKDRLESLRNEAHVLRATTTSRALRPGLVVALTDAAWDAVNRKWLIVSLEQTARDGAAVGAGDRPYEARFLAVPAEGGYRPAVPRPPRFGGVQTATIAGPAGAEIHPDPHARVRVSHRWDKRSPGDDKSSAWARTVQPSMAGSAWIPRVGWEALVAYSPSPSDPAWVLGRLDHAAHAPPEPLPAKKVWSAFGTPTSPGGGSHNRIAFDDTAGNEGMHFNASAQLSETTANDKVTAIKANDTLDVGASRTLSVGTVLEVAVDASRTVGIGASRDTNVAADESLTAASETVAIGAARFVQTGGDWANRSSSFVRIVAGGHTEVPIEHQTRLVVGGSLVANAAWETVAAAGASIGVGGASALVVAGPKDVVCAEYGVQTRAVLSETYAARSATAGGNIEQAHSVSLTYDAGSATWTAPVIVFSAKTIRIKSSGVTVMIGGGKVTISGAVSSSVASTLSALTEVK